MEETAETAETGSWKRDVVAKHARFEGDTGSPEVQVALLTSRIRQLDGELKPRRHSNGSRRYSLSKVADRHEVVVHASTLEHC